MAKKKQAPASRFESAGWGFFLILSVVLWIPFTAMAWVVSYESTEWYTRIGIGLTFAAVAAAVLTVIVNSALQYRVERLKKSQRQRGGKRK
jgi:membrane protein YdbS with pleckstrin-like domain